jgi:4-amino-4-deoxy-L-arabinose transferase-like glycosyltransferase
VEVAAERVEVLERSDSRAELSSGRSSCLLWSIVGLGLLLRVATFGLRPVWDDEAWTYFASSSGWKHLSDTLTLDSHPALFYLSEMLPLRLFGRAEWALRLVPLLSGIAAIAAGAWIQARQNGKAVGEVTAALLAASPLLVYSSQEARSYSLLTLLTLGGAWLLWKHAERPTWRGGLLALGMVLAASFTHYYGTFLLAFGAATVLLRTRKQHLAALAPTAAGLVGALALLPLIITQKRSYAGVTFNGGGYGEDLGLVRSLVRSALVIGNAGYPEGWVRPAGYALFTLVAIGLVGLALADRRQRARCVFPGVLALVLILCWQAGGRLHLWPIRDNYVAVIAPALLMLLANGLAAISRPWLRVAALASLVAVMATGDLALAAGKGRENPDYRSAASWVKAEHPDGVLLSRSWGDLSCYKYYEQQPLPLAVYGLDPTQPGGVTFEARVTGAEIQAPASVIAASRRICLLGKESGVAGTEAFQAQLREAGFTQQSTQRFDQISASVWTR